MAFDADDLEVVLRDPFDTPLFRLSRFKGGDWDPPDPMWRNARVDPPAGHKDRYAVLYVADSVEAAAVECAVLSADSMAWSPDLGREYDVIRYTSLAPLSSFPSTGETAYIWGWMTGLCPSGATTRISALA